MHGIDGCRQGWIIASIANQQLQLSFSATLLDSQALAEKSTIIIDMPVALPSTIAEYPRTCDKTAKKGLGRQHASIFYAPVIDWLNLPYLTINHACTIANAPKLSKQSFNLFPKIKELQTFEQATQHHIIESHPELIFNHYLKQPLASKKSAEGQQQRWAVIQELTNQQQIQLHADNIHEFYNQMKRVCQLDDIYDAIILALIGDDLVANQNHPLMLSSNR